MNQPSKVLRITRIVAMTVLTAVRLVMSGRGRGGEGEDGRLRVTSFPTAAHVSVDGADTGKVTPMNIRVSVGKHKVVVSMPNSGWNSDTRTVEVSEGNNDLSVTLLPNLSVGAIGPPGPTGPVRVAGAVGPVGPTGPAGAAGAIGPMGPAGPAGAVGAIGPVVA